MSMDQGIEMPLIHPVLDQFSASSSGNDALQRGMDIIIHEPLEDPMDIGTDTPMPNTTEVLSAVAGFGSWSVQPGGSVMPPGNRLANDLPRFTLSSSDSHLISIQRRVALGYHSDMYQGIYTPTKLKLAMKCPRILEAGTIQAVDVKRRYEREVETWSSFEHVNVLPFFGVVEISSNTYLVAPWVTHGDLFGFLAARLKCLADPSLGQDSVSVEKRAAFLIFDEAATIHGIASGLAYLHACGVIHGDIKAANVLLDDTLTPLLSDFGLAKKDELNATSPGMRGSGTTKWKSPGLNNGESRTTKTDIYALGMTIVEILTGRVPFPELRTSFKVCVAISQGHRPPFEPVSRHGKDFRPLWNLAASCWQQEPNKRPAAARVVARTASLRLKVPPRRTHIEIDDDVSSDIVHVVFEQVDGQSNTLRGDQPISSGSHGGSRREPKVAAFETESLGSTGEQNDRTCNSLIDTVAIYKELGDRGMMAHCMKSLGDIKRTQGHYEDACTFLRDSIAIYEEFGYRSMVAHCLVSVGEIKETQGHYDEACASLREAAAIYKTGSDAIRMAHCLRSIGVIKESQGDYDDACASLSEAHVVFTRLGDRGTTAQCLKSMGEIKGTQGNYDDALTLLGESYEISKQLDNRGFMAHCLKSIGWTKGKQGRYDDACTSLYEAAAIYKELGERRKAAHCLKSIVKIKKDQGHYDETCMSLNEAALLYKDLGDRSRMADCLRSIGVIKGSQEYYHDACSLLSEAAIIYKEVGNRSRMVDCLHSIIEIKEDQGRNNDAIASLSEAYTICTQLGDKNMMASCLKSIGETRKTQGAYDNAHTALSEAAAMYKELGDQDMVAYCLKLMGEIKGKQGHNQDARISLSEAATIYTEIARAKKDEGQDDSACTSLNHAATIYKELGDRNGAAGCLKSIAQIKEDLGEYEDAYTWLNDALTIYKELGDRNKATVCLESIANIKNGLGEYDETCTSLNDAATIYKELGDRNGAAGCLKSIAEFEEAQEEYADACTSLNDALTIYKELGDRNSEINCLKSIAHIKEDLGEYDDACTSLNDALAIYKELGDRNSAAGCLKSMAELKKAKKEYADACTLLNDALTIYKELGDRNSAAGCLQSIAQIKEAHEQYADACASLNDALAICKELGGQKGIASCLQSIAQIKRAQKEYEDACALLTDAATIYKGLNNQYGMASCLKAIGEIRKLQGRHSDAFISLREAWMIANTIRFCFHIRGDIMQTVEVLLGDWRQSSPLIPKGAEHDELPRVLNETCGMVDNLLRIGKVSHERGHDKEAMESFSDAHELLDGLECGGGLVECLRCLTKVQEKQKDPVKHIQCLVRLAGALEPINVPWPNDSEATEEGYMVVLRAGKLLGSLGGVWVPRGLRVEVAQLHVRLAIAFHARLRPKKARSILLEAGRLLQQPGEELQVMENLTRLEGVLLQADYIRESIVVLEELRRVQLELHEKMPLNEWYEVARRRVWR